MSRRGKGASKRSPLLVTKPRRSGGIVQTQIKGRESKPDIYGGELVGDPLNLPTPAAWEAPS
jgi:hypothetical protein